MSGSTIAIIIIIVALLVILFTSYVKSPPDKAYIISGLRKTPKILIGKAGLKLPFFERKDELLIKQISIDIKTDDYVPTLDFIGVNIDAVAKVKIRTDEEGMQLAMKNFLNMKEPQIMEEDREIIIKTEDDSSQSIPLSAPLGDAISTRNKHRSSYSV